MPSYDKIKRQSLNWLLKNYLEVRTHSTGQLYLIEQRWNCWYKFECNFSF
jgi:hypothetical protein